ncbi:MAG: RNA polymerase sigma factor [Ignavibacteriae bacterium]|nr:RNA polymerase sigma factor [Ignavibacteriota bacterium]
MSQQTDAELIVEFKDGNVSGFNELVRRYQKKVYWIARRIVGSHEEADDVTQDVFIKVYEKLKDFRGDSEFYTWLYRITVNTSFSVVSKRKFKDLFQYHEVEDRVDIGEEADKALLQKEYQSLLDVAIADLPTQQKAVFQLRYFDELPYQEIAKIMNRSEGAVKANYFFALNKIKNSMQKEYQL